MENQNQNTSLEATGQLRDINLSVWSRSSEKLMSCLVKLEIPELKQEAKMELVSLTSELMPKGAPNLLGVIKYPTIDRLGQEVGKKGVFLMILALVRDLCNSLNVVRNMNEDQMMETASMLLDECGNFRLEDYVMMFSMAKRGQLVKIFDRVDIDLVGQMMDEYWLRRNAAGRRAQDEEYKEFEDKVKLAERNPVQLTPEEENIQDKFYRDMKDTAIQLCVKDPAEAEKEEIERKDRVRKHVEFFKSTLTPDQLKEIDQRRREIETAASLYEIEQKKRGKAKSRPNR